MASHVRIQSEAYSKLQKMADEAGVTVQALLAEAIDDLYRKRFVDACNLAYGRLKSDPKAWRREISERRAWEKTLNDELEDA